MQAAEIGEAVAQSGVADFKNAAHLCAFANTHMACFTAQPSAFTTKTSARATKAGEIFAHHGRIGLAITPFHIDQDALKRVFFIELFTVGL